MRRPPHRPPAGADGSELGGGAGHFPHPYRWGRTGPGLARLADDLDTGRWHARHAGLLTHDTMDAGYRLLVADL